MTAALRKIELTGEHSPVDALQFQVSGAHGDYQRLRAAYIELARIEPSHAVALAMFGADMDRAHAYLQALAGLPSLPFTSQPSAVLKREAMRLTSQDED